MELVGDTELNRKSELNGEMELDSEVIIERTEPIVVVSLNNVPDDRHFDPGHKPSNMPRERFTSTSGGGFVWEDVGLTVGDTHDGPGHNPSRIPSDTLISKIPGLSDDILLVALVDVLRDEVVVLWKIAEPDDRQFGPLHNPPSTSTDRLTSTNGGRVPT